MSYHRRSIVAWSLVTLAVAGAATAAWNRPELPSAGVSAPTVPAAALIPTALDFTDFLDADSKQAAHWAARYEESEAYVAALLPRVRELPGHWHLLVVAETWCTDALYSVPSFARLAAESPNLDLVLLRKSDGQSLLNAYPLDGRGKIPLVVVLDEDFNERGVWIERPAALRARVDSLRTSPGTTDLGASVRAWYAADGGRSALAEIVTLLEELARGAGPPAAGDPDAEYTPIQCNMPE